MRREFSPHVRREAMIRCKNRCERCGSKTSLQFHHVGNARDNSLFNCQVLCEPCHVTEHVQRKRVA